MTPGVITLKDSNRVKSMETTRLPLNPINYGVYLSNDDLSKGKPWPPLQFKERNESLKLLRQLYNGDLSQLLDTRDRKLTRVQTNHFLTEISQLSSILLAVPTEIEGAEIDISDKMLSEALSRSLVDQFRYGGAIMLAIVSQDGLSLDVVDPEYYYPLGDGRTRTGFITAVPIVSSDAENSEYDKLEVTYVVPSTAGIPMAFRMLVDINESAIDTDIATLNPEPIGFQLAFPVLLSPTANSWGTSIIRTLAPLVLEKAIRLSSASHILNANERPTWALTNKEAATPEDILTGASDTASPEEKAAAQEAIDRTEVLTEIYQTARDADLAIINVAASSASSLEWKGNITASLSLVQELNKDITNISLIPEALRSGTAASGTALKLQSTFFYTKTREMLERTKETVDYLLSEITRKDVSLSWPHYLDSLAPEAEEPATIDIEVVDE